MSPETIRYFLSLDMKVAFIWIGLIGVKSTGISVSYVFILQLLEMTGMTETVGMVPITNINEPGGFRIGRVGKVYPHYFEVKVKDR